MKRRSSILIAAGVGTALVIILALTLTVGGAVGKGAAGKGAAGPPHGVPAPFGSVEFFISETELTAENEIGPKEVPSFPKIDPAKISDAYEYTKTGPKAFEMKQDVFLPSAITVHQGDVVALRIFDVEGQHKLTLFDPTGAKLFSKFKTYGGREYLKVFTPKKVGIYKLVCENHDPTMKMIITVLRKGA